MWSEYESMLNIKPMRDKMTLIMWEKFKFHGGIMMETNLHLIWIKWMHPWEQLCYIKNTSCLCCSCSLSLYLYHSHTHTCTHAHTHTFLKQINDCYKNGLLYSATYLTQLCILYTCVWQVILGVIILLSSHKLVSVIFKYILFLFWIAVHSQKSQNKT